MPIRPAGTPLAAASNWTCRWSSGKNDHQGVSTMPGETALTRTGASSAARGETIRSIAPLTAAKAMLPGIAARALAAEINGDRLGYLRLSDCVDVGEQLRGERRFEVVQADLTDGTEPYRAWAEGEHEVLEGPQPLEELSDGVPVRAIELFGRREAAVQGSEFGRVTASNDHVHPGVGEMFGGRQPDPRSSTHDHGAQSRLLSTLRCITSRYYNEMP
jgi:hypothetical protein